MSNFSLVVDTNRQPLDPIHPAKARILLSSGKAAILRRFPFTIILKEAVNLPTQAIELKLDPGSKTTGIALVSNQKVFWAGELTHRGQAIKDALLSRHHLRRSRRNRKTRYRAPRFLNRARPDGWLTPSLQHRVDTTLTWVKRLIKFAPITTITQELVKFDFQKLENPEISGVEYQQGELRGYEVREFLLEKWERQCTYCGIKNVPLQIEHIIAKSRGGSNKISNLCLACEPCNLKKGTQPVEQFLSDKPELLKQILVQAKRSLKDAAAVNSTRWKLFNSLKELGLSVTTGSGGLTKFNRRRLNLPKTHWIDAACVGKIKGLKLLTNQPLVIKANGHGTRQMCRTDKFGFPIRYVPRWKFVNGFQTGDIVKAVVTKGKKVGTYFGRIAVRSSGSFNLSTKTGLVQGISHKYCTTIHRKDGFNYSF